MVVKMHVDKQQAWIPGWFSVFYFYVAQGDCMFVKCPGGETVMVDCGSSKGWTDGDVQVIKDQSRPYLNGNRLDFLILTHCDRDHYNLVEEVWKGLEIGTVLFSGAYANDSPLGNYSLKNINNFFYQGKPKTTNIYEVTIRRSELDEDESERFYKRWNCKDQFKNLQQTAPIVQDALKILSGTAMYGNPPVAIPYSVSIVAGNCKPPIGKGYDKETEANIQSLATIFALGNLNSTTESRIGAFGDATASVESFLVDHQAIYVDDLDLMNAPHHGSNTSSTPPFLFYVNPKNVVVSVANEETGHCLPRQTAITNYYDGTDLIKDIHEHPIDLWRLASDFQKGSTNEAYAILDNWKRTKTPYHQIPDRSTPAYKLDTMPPPPGGDFLVIPSKGMICKSTYTTNSVRTTGLEVAGIPFLYFTVRPS